MSTPYLDGKVALVTGASRGLGLSIARGLRDAGATVIVSSRKLDACEVAVRSLGDSGPGSAHPFALHVGKWESIEPAVDEIIATYGSLDIVVNNAGIAPLAENLVSVTESLWDKTIEVNLKGPFRLMAVAGDRMVASGSGGSIINISSIGAVRPSPPEAMYAAAKNGLNALTMAFAQEYGPTVRVNCIMPGGFATDMAENWDDEFIGKIIDRLPAGRLGNPDEIAGLVTHLAGDAAGYTTGAIIPVDGGRTAVY